MSFRERVSTEKNERFDSGLLRTLKTIDSAQGVIVKRGGRELINFSSNDYLGLANFDELKVAAQESVAKWGVGAAASHLVCGHQSPHERLESEIAAFVGAEKAIVFSTGYMANLAVPNAFLNRHELLLQDKLNHASLIDAGLLCRATSKRYQHLDVDHARQLIEQSNQPNLMVATDGVFSMNGNVADVQRLAELCDHQNRLLLVDDAHGFGVLGRNGAGTLEEAGLKPSGQTLMIGTLSKAVGSFGAFVAGDAIWIDHLIQNARPYIYTTALPPAVIDATRVSLRLIRESSRRERLLENVALFRKLAAQHGVEVFDSSTPIQSVLFGSPTDAVAASEALAEAGFLVVAIRPPTVPEGTSRLRITLSADHESSQIERLVDAMVIK